MSAARCQSTMMLNGETIQCDRPDLHTDAPADFMHRGKRGTLWSYPNEVTIGIAHRAADPERSNR